MVASLSEARVHVMPAGPIDPFGRSQAAYSEPRTGDLAQGRASAAAVVELRDQLAYLRSELDAFLGDPLEVQAGPSLRSQRLGSSVDPDAPISQVEAFASLDSGVFYINGVGLSLDAQADSLHDLVARINTTPAGVTASYQEQVLKLRFDVHDRDRELTLDSGGTGFFEALGLPQGRFRQLRGGRNSEPVVQALERAAEELQRFFEQQDVSPELQSRLRRRLHDAVASVIGGGRETYATPYGVRFDLRRDTDEVLQLVGGTSETFRKALERDAKDIQHDLAGTARTGDIFGNVLGELRRSRDQLARSYSTGILVDLEA